MEDRLLTTDEVVRYLKIPKSTLYKLSEKGQIPSVKIGKQLRFRKSSLDNWLEQKETKSFGKSSQLKEILIIDDDKLILRSLVKFLESHGYRVEPAESGEEALKKIEKSSFDLIIVDVRMPRMNGIQTIKRIRELNRNFNRPAVPEIIITGFADTQAQQEAERLGITDYLYKPFVTTDFMDTVKKRLKASDSN